MSRAAFQVVIVLFFSPKQRWLRSCIADHRSGWRCRSSCSRAISCTGLRSVSRGVPRPLRRSRRLNEVDGIILGVMSFMSFSLYRATHQSHHAHLATERDEELWPFVHPGMPRWGRVLAAFLELTAGLLFTPFLFLRTFLACRFADSQQEGASANLG